MSNPPWDSHALSRELARHRRTTGMAVSMGVTCSCGYHETRRLARASGDDGLDVHRAEVALRTVTPPERLILTGLIAELRDCPVIPIVAVDQEPLRDMADRAEARLREVTGDE